jgi:hypothetical protein
VEHVLGLRVKDFRQLIKDVPHLMEPAPLNACFGPYLRKGRLKPHSTVAHSKGGAFLSPRLRISSNISSHDCSLSLRPFDAASNSLLPKESAPMTTSKQDLSFSSQALQYTPSAHT